MPAAIPPTSITDPNNHVETMTFSASGYFTGGKLLTDTLGSGTPLAQTTTNTWDLATGLLQNTTDSLGRQTAFTYDPLGNRTSVTMLASTSQPVTTTWTYDPTFSQVISFTDALQHTSTFAYDGNGNLTSVANALQQTTVLAYNGAGQLITVTPPSPAGVIRFDYTGADLTSVTDPQGNTTGLAVDGLGRILSKTLPLGQTTNYQYDSNSRLSQSQDPLGAVTAFGYDPSGNLTSVSDALSNATGYTYDSRNQRLARTDPLRHSESSGFDLNGNLVSFTDRKGQITSYTYDALDRLQQVQYADKSTTSYTYDAGDRLVQIADSLSGTIMRQYDSLDRLTQEQTPQGTVQYSYDAAGRRTSMTVSGQTNPVSYSYDKANHLVQVAQGLNLVAIGYDTAGRRTRVTLPNGITSAYTYDAASELTGITYTNSGGSVLGTLTYGYDVNGNRIQVGGTLASTNLPAGLASATYNANNQLVQRGFSSFSYDLNGNLITDGTNTYSWDARNQLALITGSVLVSPQYDAFGRRTLNPAGQNLLYDGGNLVQEQSGGSVTANLLTGLGIDERFVRTDSSGDHSYLIDGLNSTVALTDSNANAAAQYTYDPFGNTTMTGASTNVQEFTGRENDGTGLYYYRARYYSPQMGRFISEDPMQFRADVNFYSYAGNAPTEFIDPQGWDKTIFDGGFMSVPQSLGIGPPMLVPVAGANGRELYNGPRNGNWGGLNWGGGWNPAQHGGREGSAAPTDSADRCYQAHDYCYDKNCSDGGKKSCDRELVKCLRALPQDSKSWPQPPKPGTEGDSSRYRWRAITYFGGGLP